MVNIIKNKLKINNKNNFNFINNITIASMKLNRFIKNLECDIGKRLLHDTVIMEGFVDIINGDKIVHGKNSVVDQGLATMINFLSCHYYSNYMPSFSFWSSTTYSFMVIGSDTANGTKNGMTGLSTPIGTAPGTKPTSQSGTTSNPTTGQWQVQWTSTWSPGTLPAATLGEVGLYLYIIPTLQSFGANNPGPGTYMFSRMSSADLKFTAFPINNTVPLSIAWTFRLTYST